MPACRQSITSFTLIADTNGTVVNALWPNLRRITTFTYDQALGITGIQMTSSLSNVTAAAMGIVVIVGQDRDTITASEAMNMYLSHLSNTNSTAGFPNPASRTSGAGFGEEGIYLAPRQPVSLYAFSDNDASNLVFALCNLYTVLAK